METETIGFIENVFKIGGPGVGIGFFFGASIVLYLFVKKFFDLIEKNNDLFTELQKSLVKLETILNERLPHD